METSNAAAEFIYGIRDIESDRDWDTYVQMVNHAGLMQYLKIGSRHLTAPGRIPCRNGMNPPPIARSNG